MDPFTIVLLGTSFLLFLGGLGGTIYHEKHRNRGAARTRTRTRQTRAAVIEEHMNVEVIQLLKRKCVDKAPNCNQNLCQNYKISLWKKCKKTCGVCHAMKN